MHLSRSGSRASITTVGRPRNQQSPPRPSMTHRVDTVKVAAALDLAEISRADPEFVRATTGFVIGGVAPVGHLHPVRTVVDVSLSRYDTIWAAAGHPRAVFSTSYDELIRMSGGLPTEVV